MVWIFPSLHVIHLSEESAGSRGLGKRLSIFRGNGPKTDMQTLRMYLIKCPTSRVQAWSELQDDGEAAQRETGGIKEPKRNGKFNFLKPL